MIGYVDCFAGVSGDMLLGALVDCGWPLERLQDLVARLKLDGVTVAAERVSKHGIQATQITVHSSPNQPQRGHSDLEAIVLGTEIPTTVQEQALSAIKLLAEAESAVHGVPLDQIHFHEIGAVDTVVDIVGALLGMHELGVDWVHSAPLPWSQGTIQTRHGMLPVPPPAVANLMQGLPVVGVNVQGEMVTPTGAALVRTLAQEFGQIRAMRVERVGYGAGQREWPDRPNLLRLVLGYAQDARGLTTETLTVLACNLDDMNPQWYGPLVETLLGAKALDVWLTPAQMKKNRPATIVEVLCRASEADMLRDLLLRHTTTLGIRQYTVTRHSVERRIEAVETPYGAVRVKVATLPDGQVKAAPEHDDCVARAAVCGVSVREVWQAALHAIVVER